LAARAEDSVTFRVCPYGCPWSIDDDLDDSEEAWKAHLEAHMDSEDNVTCKIEGCPNPDAGKGGPWKRMCNEHISSEMSRRNAVRYDKKPAAKNASANIANLPVAETNGHATVSLTDLAHAVETSRLRLDQAVTDLRAALEHA
jgi:hypothetical protein